MADISAPNAAAYSIWGPQYAQALAAQTQGPVAGPLNMLAMRGYMGGEQGAYSDALAGTQQNQLALARMEAEAKLQEQLISSAAPLAAAGATQFLQPAYDQFGVGTNSFAGQEVDDAALAEAAAMAFKNNTAGAANLADVGYLPTPEVLSDTVFPGNAPGPALMPYMTPDAKNDQMRAQAAQTQAQASMTNAQRPRSSGGGGGGQTTEIRMTPNPITGVMEPTIVVRKAGPDLINQYMPGGTPTPEQTGGAESTSARLERLRQRRGD